MFSLYLLQQHYRKLGTSEWLTRPVMEPLLESITQELQVAQGSTESCHQVRRSLQQKPRAHSRVNEWHCIKSSDTSLQKLVCQMHQDVAVEYVRRLLKGGVKLKDQNLQLKAFNRMKDDAENLHRFFSRMVGVDRRASTNHIVGSCCCAAKGFSFAGLSGRLVEGRLDQHCRSAETPGPLQHSAARGAHGKLLP